MQFTEEYGNTSPVEFSVEHTNDLTEDDQYQLIGHDGVLGHVWQNSIDIGTEIGLYNKGILTIEKATDIIAERLKLLPLYGTDAELGLIIAEITQAEDEEEFWEIIEWLKDWGDHGRRLFVKDF